MNWLFHNAGSPPLLATTHYQMPQHLILEKAGTTGNIVWGNSSLGANLFLRQLHQSRGEPLPGPSQDDIVRTKRGKKDLLDLGEVLELSPCRQFLTPADDASMFTLDHFPLWYRQAAEQPPGNMVFNLRSVEGQGNPHRELRDGGPANGSRRQEGMSRPGGLSPRTLAGTLRSLASSQ